MAEPKNEELGKFLLAAFSEEVREGDYTDRTYTSETLIDGSFNLQRVAEVFLARVSAAMSGKIGR